MTQSMNGAVKKVIAGVITALLVFIITAVLSNQNRVTALEVKMQAIEKSLDANRVENREDHQRILDEIKALRK